ncbi:MAG TPA: hypothetical protein VJ779_12800 [Acetobacteraceae bacterium]|nr:hypothetical protein [Acetobacteraceae bacterium]
MTRQLLKLTLTWAFLMAVAGGEFVVSGMQMEMANRPVLLFFAGTMVFTVAMMFMHLATAPVVAKGFAVAGVFWLIVLFGFGAADMLTRNWYPVQHYNPY